MPDDVVTQPAAETTAPVKATAPHHVEDLLLPADPKVKEYLDKLVTEREQLKAREKAASAAAQDAIKQLADMKAAKEAEAQASLVEQGKFKELFEAATKRNQELEAQQQFNTVQAAVAQELTKHGAVDMDIASLVLQKYSGAISFQNGGVFGVVEAVEKYKQDKPAFFKSAEAAVPPPPAATGLRMAPPAVSTTNKVNWLDPTIKKEDVHVAWQDLVKSLSPPKY